MPQHWQPDSLYTLAFDHRKFICRMVPQAATTHWNMSDGSYICIMQTHTMDITNIPVAFITMLPTKADQTGRNGPRACYRNKKNNEFCLVKALFLFLHKYPPTRSTHGVFSGVTTSPSVIMTSARDLFRRTAIKTGLDPKRLVLHSGRVGLVAQVLNGGFDANVHTGFCMP